MKFSLTKNKKVELGVTLYQIKAEETKNGINKGDLGGWIEKKENLSMFGDAWVSGDAWVFGDAKVSGNALVSGDAKVSGNAWVYGDAWVCGNAWVSGDARVCGKLKISLGYFFGTRLNNEEIKYKKIDDKNELIYKGEAKFEEEDDEVERAIKLLEEKGVIINGKILK